MHVPEIPAIILATRNPGKLREIRALLSSLPFRIVGLDDHSGVPGWPVIPEIEETGETLEENALIKAKTVYRLTRVITISDDSGLEVDFLGGAPGVRSARFAGEGATYDDNNRKLLSLLAPALEPGTRRARFRCVAACVGPGFEHVAEGGCSGRIAEKMSGRGGFGYDPVFIPEGYKVTFADLPPAEKNVISHRHEAFAGMEKYLRTVLDQRQR